MSRNAKNAVRTNKADYNFSPGKHNSLQKAIIDEFVPRFVPRVECLYVEDTMEKDMIKT